MLLMDMILERATAALGPRAPQRHVCELARIDGALINGTTIIFAPDDHALLVRGDNGGLAAFSMRTGTMATIREDACLLLPEDTPAPTTALEMRLGTEGEWLPVEDWSIAIAAWAEREPPPLIQIRDSLDHCLLATSDANGVLRRLTDDAVLHQAIIPPTP